MRCWIGLLIVGGMAACSSFGTDSSSPSSTGPTDGGADALADAGSADASAAGSPCTPGAGHLFCADFNNGSLGEWEASEKSDDTVKLDVIAAAAHEGADGLRVTIPADKYTHFHRIDQDVHGVAPNELTYAFWMRVTQPNSTQASTEVASLDWALGDASPSSQVVVQHAGGKLFLGYEENGNPLLQTETLAAPADWQQVVVTVTGLVGAKPTMKLSVGAASTPAVPLTPSTTFDGNVTLEMGAGYVEANISATSYDLDDVTFDAK